MSKPDGTETVWAGRAPCGCFLFVSVDEEPGTPAARDMNRDISALRKKGWTIERKTLQWVWDGGLDACPHRKPRSSGSGQQELPR